MSTPPEQPAGSDEFLPWLEQRAAQRRKSRITGRKKAGAVTLGVAALLVVSAVWNPPTASVHSFSKASDYNPARESGCTNSGKGCHGSETRFTDFNSYHKNAGCTDCHDYQGVGCIPCHKPSQSECELCHDGTMKNAPDVVRLTDDYPRGHYRETTHTAMGTDFRQVTRASAEGKAKASCAECHSRDLKRSHSGVKPVPGSPYAEKLRCGDCHNDTRTSAVTQVLSKWKARACEDCHGRGSSAPMHDAKVAPAVEASGPAACGATGDGCHEGGDLHAMHPDKPAACTGSAAKGEPGCHAAGLEAQVPTATACGAGAPGCHARYRTDAFGHSGDRKAHSPGGAVAADTSYRGIACGRCHHMGDDGRSLQVEHDLWTSAKTGVPGNTCRDCHNSAASQDALTEGWPGRQTEYACDDCHGKNGLGREHVADLPGVHGSPSEGCASTGPGCHPTDDLSQVGVPTVTANIHVSCLRCHDASASGGNRSYDPRKKTCGSGRDCHGGFDTFTAVHEGRRGRVDGADALHTAGTPQRDARLTDGATGLAVRCGVCHQMGLGPEHGRPSSGIARGGDTLCERCHDATPLTAATVKSGWSARQGASACAACHGTADVPAPHAAIDTAHADATLDVRGSLDAGACVRSGCHATAEVRILHRAVGCAIAGCHSSRGDINGRDIRSCGGTDPKTSCHTGYEGGDGHETAAARHEGFELDPFGNLAPGSCARAGCHTSVDLRRLHRAKGCAITGCHETGKTPSITGCGGPDALIGCHPGFTADEHFVDHSADVTGTVNGVTYRAGENVGCFGCHSADLRAEHSTGTPGPSIAGGGASDCRVCHYDPDDPGSGAYSGLPAVSGAIAARDRRCGTCHASGSAANGPVAAASPHKRISPAFPPPDGYVSAEPEAEWRAAFEAPTGGGHNVLPSDLVGAAAGRRFPVTSYTRSGRTHTWALPPNSGLTRWLRASVFPGADTTSAVQGVTIGCQDCHVLPADMRGPHGSAVPVSIDPAYSQTEYAEPTRGTASQFAASGTERVICFKCHDIQAGSVPGTSAPGGGYVHAQHAEHPGFPAYNPVRWGEKCIDCHVRIPHAWRHQRLLVRTVSAGDGVPADEYPYVRAGHDGLLGVLLRDFETTADPRPFACVTGGCHGRHNVGSHPMPADVPGEAYWP
jgi:hypothetical protein